MRQCPKCGSASPENSVTCTACGLDLEVLYLPYPLLALLVVIGFRMVQATELALITTGFGPKVLFLALCSLLGTLAYGLAKAKTWGPYLAYVIATLALLFALRALLQQGQNFQAYRLMGESLYLLGYLIFTKK